MGSDRAEANPQWHGYDDDDPLAMPASSTSTVVRREEEGEENFSFPPLVEGKASIQWQKEGRKISHYASWRVNYTFSTHFFPLFRFQRIFRA